MTTRFDYYRIVCLWAWLDERLLINWINEEKWVHCEARMSQTHAAYDN